MRSFFLLQILLVLSSASRIPREYSRLGLHFNSQLGCADNPHSDLLLSIVVTTTNTAPADQLQRLQFQIENIFHFTQKYNLVRKVEYIIVEYNYNPNNASLRSLLRFEEYMPIVRIIRVDPDAHRIITSQMGVPFPLSFLEFYAKNIGIRRACSPFILPTNSDVLFSEGFWYFVRHGTLKNTSYYRIPRCNSNGDLSTLQKADSEQRLQHVKERLTDCWWCEDPKMSWQIYVSRPYEQMNVSDTKDRQYTSCIQAPGDFLVLSKAMFFAFRGYPDVALPHQIDDLPVWMATAAGLFLSIPPAPAVVYHVNHDKPYQKSDGRWSHAHEMVDTYRLDALSGEAIHKKQLEVYNGEDWGFAGWEFEENVF